MPKQPYTAEQIKKMRSDYQKRRLWQLAYAHESFRRAKEVAELYLITPNLTPELAYVFTSSVCITYSRMFINSVLGILSKEFTTFPDDKLRKTHESLLHSRNNLYAHTDMTETFPLTINIKKRDGRLVYDYKIADLNLRDIIFPDIVPLCVHQMKVATDSITETIVRVLPQEHALTVLRVERSNESTVEIKYPIDPNKAKEKS